MTCLQHKTEMPSPGKQLSFLLVCLLAPAIIGLSLNNCGGSSNDKAAEVVRGENSSFTCTLDSAESTHTLEWRVKTGQDINVGRCPVPSNGDTCTSKSSQIFTPMRTEPTQSVMTVDPTKANLFTEVEAGTLICQDQVDKKQDSCPMDYITRASGTCSSRVDTDTNRWTVQVDCNITKGNSSRGRYMCQWFSKKEGNTNEVAVTSLSNMTSNTLPTGSARCSVSLPLPSQTGRYTYRVMFLPGRQLSVAGTVDISRPSTPTITCTPTAIVTENSTLMCTCTTGNVGQPTGRLRWLKGSSNVISPGTPGVDRLEMSQTLNRSDNGAQFCCRLDWSNVTVTSTVYTASVGYPPSTSELTVSPSSPSGSVTVNENSTVTFTCRATGGNPPSNMTLSHATSTLRSDSSPLTFDLPAARCEHSGVYTCKGTNGYGHDVIHTASLLVRCSPRSVSQISELNFINTQVGTTFYVTAYPAPTLAFSYLGRSENTTGSPKNISDSIKMNGRCEETGSIVHRSTCTITVSNVTSDEVAGIYQVNVSNTEGKTNAKFEVQYKAQVQPPQESSHAAVIIIVSIVATVIVAVIFVGVVCYLCKRRKAMPEIISWILICCHCLRKHKRSTAAGRPRNGQGRNNYHDMEESGPADADTEAQSRPLSFAPMAVYAQVDRKNKNRKAAAAPEPNGGQPADEYAQVDKLKKFKEGAADQDAEANGEQPADVYAEVDKTKKKQASGAGAKPKTGAEAAGKPKKEKKKKDKRDESAHVYGNVEEIKQGKGDKVKKTTTPSKEEASSGKMVNPDGLIYTSVEFSQPPKSGKPAPKKPEEEPVVYSAVDFKKSPPAP